MSIEIKPFEAGYFDRLVDMALENYNMERMKNYALCDDIDKSYFYRNLHELFSEGTVNVAFEDSGIVGYLAFDKNAMSNTKKSATSPLYGYGIKHARRGEVISKLFQNTASTLCENYAQNLWVNVYAHDSDVLWTYIMSAFAMDVTDVIRDTGTPVESKPVNFVFKEVDKRSLLEHRIEVIELYRNLINHLRVSPIFYHCKYFLPIEERFEDFLSDNMRIFSVFDGSKLIGMVNAEPPDKGFAIEDTYAMSLGDLFVAPDYRRKGIAVALLNYANNELKKSGVKRLFVTHGTINPTARGFWDKYFNNYSYTMTRQINPDMLGVIKLV